MKTKQTTMTGKVESLNVSPDGYYESAVFSGPDGAFQVNLSDYDEDIPEGWKVGEEATVQVIPYEDEHKSDHPVFELVPAQKEISGRVKLINYALHGEQNGVVLEGGEFIHLKPPIAKAAQLKVGQEITVTGLVWTQEDGPSIVEPVTLDGQDVDKIKKKKG